MNIEIYDINDANEPSIVVICAKYNDKFVMCRHKGRKTWEIPGGHIEKGELPESAAKRELYEETGATEFVIVPEYKYAFETNGKKVFSIMYKGTISKMEPLPDFEIEEIKFFDELPQNVTYPEIYEKILKD